MAPKAAKNGKERRKEQRHKVSRKVGCATPDLSFIDYISDINGWGVFVQSEQHVPVGESIVLTIPLMGDQQSIKVIGTVVWTSPQGMGVSFGMGIDNSVLKTILEE